MTPGKPFIVGAFGILAGFALVALFYWVGKSLRPPNVLRGAMVNPPRPAVDFTLTDGNQHEHSLRDFRHQAVVLLYFGDINSYLAKNTLSRLVAVREMLQQNADFLQIIMITTNPTHNAPADLLRFVQGFDDSIIGLWGPPKDIRDIANSYDIYFPISEEGGETSEIIDHTPLVMLIDMDGFWCAVYPMSTTSQDIAADINAVLETAYK